MGLILSRAKAKEIFADIPQEQDRQNIVTIPEFKPTCRAVSEWWAAKEKIKLLLGANQSGKSTTGGAYVADFARHHPGALIWAVGMNFDRTRVCFQKLLEYIAPEEIDFIVWAARAKGIAHSIRHINGAEIIFKSADAGFMKFEGDAVNLVWIDEEIRDKQVYSSCVARTTMTGGQILMTMTPLNGKTWVYYDLVKESLPDVFVRTITLYDNTYLDPIMRDQMIRMYSAREIPYRVYGKWGTVEGRIYDEFAESSHVIPYDQAIVDRCHTVLRAIDFGRTLACVWVGIDDYEIAYVIADLKISECALDDFVGLLADKESEIGLTPKQNVITYSDHAFQERFELERYSIFCIPAEKAVEAGIEVVRRRLKVQEDGKMQRKD